MKLDEFDYTLPESLIATHPTTPRSHSRLLHFNRKTQSSTHLRFDQITQLIPENSLLVVNDTKVIPARLYGEAKGRQFEVFLLESLDPMEQRWKCLVRPGKKIHKESTLYLPEGKRAQVFFSEASGFEIRFSFDSPDEFHQWLERNGHVPLPPYIKREDRNADKTTYQTVYAKHRGSIAAPTAGLHFTDELLEAIETKGVELIKVCLHVGYGTFSPIRVDNIESHEMHPEWYTISENNYRKILNAKEEGKKITAVGTTSLRTLESTPLYGREAWTRLFIKPGDSLSLVDQLITNFHLPKSSLFVLICAILGTEQAKSLYREAIQKQYRFYSYGDAMLIS